MRNHRGSPGSSGWPLSALVSVAVLVSGLPGPDLPQPAAAAGEPEEPVSTADETGTTPEARVDTSRANDARALEQGRLFTRWFYERNLDALHERFAPEMSRAMGIDALRAFRDQVADQIGAEASLLDESVMSQKGLQIYTRRAKFTEIERAIDVVWVFNAGGQVAGFVIKPAPEEYESPFLDYEPRSRLRLPVDGKWHVAWGGRAIKDNYHAMTRDQRFALDLVIMRSGTTHEGDGTANEQYYAFGQKILAPAAGRVVVAADSVPDNAPGQMNPGAPPGNHVVIDHENGEFSFLCHFKAGSVAVKAGDRVAEGDLLGLCGNSGNSSEPHLHYHLQNTAEFGAGDGLPARFHDYRADGAPIASGEPSRGQVLEPVR